MDLKLVILAGKHRGQKIKLPRTQFVIGRDNSCHLRPISTDVSKFHCAIARVGDRVLVRDLGSTNGTFLNDRRISRTVRFCEGDVLQVGPLKFRLLLEDESHLGDSSPEWLLRLPDDQEHKVLDGDSDTTVLEGPISSVNADEAKSTDSEEATVVAGRFLRDYVGGRKQGKQSDKLPRDQANS